MDWKDLKPILGGTAPLIGKLVGIGASFIPGIGPIVGPIIGPAVGNILAGVFGVPATPEAVANAIQSNPDEVVKAKLAAATEQIKAQYAWAAAVETGELKLEEVAFAQTNETMRAEVLNQSLFFTGWRPAIGWVFVVVAVAFGLMLTGVAALACLRSREPLKLLYDVWPLFAAYFGVLGAMVGVLIPSRSIEKKAAMETGTPLGPVRDAPALPAPAKSGGTAAAKPLVDAPVRSVTKITTAPGARPPFARSDDQ